MPEEGPGQAEQNHFPSYPLAALSGGTPPQGKARQGRLGRHFTRPQLPPRAGRRQKLLAKGGRARSLIGAPHAVRCPGGRGAPGVGSWAAAAAALRRLLLPHSRAARTGRSRSSAAAWASPRRPHGGLRAAPALAAAAAAPCGAAPLGAGRLRARRAPLLTAFFGRQVRCAAPTAAAAAALPPPPPARGGGQRPARLERRRRPRADTAAGATGSRRRAAALRGQEAAGPGASRALETDRYRPRPSRPAPRGFGGAGRGRRGALLSAVRSGGSSVSASSPRSGAATRPERRGEALLGAPGACEKLRTGCHPALSFCLVLEGGKAEVGEVRELGWCWFPPLCVCWTGY